MQSVVVDQIQYPCCSEFDTECSFLVIDPNLVKNLKPRLPMLILISRTQGGSDEDLEAFIVAQSAFGSGELAMMYTAWFSDDQAIRLFIKDTNIDINVKGQLGWIALGVSVQ